MMRGEGPQEVPYQPTAAELGLEDAELVTRNHVVVPRNIELSDAQMAQIRHYVPHPEQEDGYQGLQHYLTVKEILPTIL